jgi:hypothetical protein
MANWNGDKEKPGSVPELLNEREAAMILRVKAATVRAERIRGKIAYTRIGARIFYTLQQVSDYLERQSVPACASNESNVQVKSGATGSVKSQAETALKKRGAAPGMTHGLDRHLVSALARQIFARQASSSPHGLSQTSDRGKPRRTKS